MKFYIKVSPNAKKNKIIDINKDMFDNFVFKLQIKAVPEKGKANEELIKFLSETFDVPKKEISILKGQTSQLKLVEIKSLTEEVIGYIKK